MMILLRLVHILSAIFWVGSAMFTAFFLIPSLRETPATMGAVAQALNKRGFMIAMPIAGLLVILSGGAMLSMLYGGQMGVYMSTPGGRVLGLAAALGILSLVVGIIFAKPANMKTGQIAAQLQATTDAAERTRLQGELAAAGKKAGIATLAVTTLMILAAAGMAIARYVQ